MFTKSTSNQYRLIKKQSKLGFSIIEISVVILIIGILGVGASKGSLIVRGAQLKSAQSLSISSPVLSTPGLALWLDAVSQKSFSSASDGSPIAVWHDINALNATGTAATQQILSNQPIYLEKGINNLPSVSFIRSNNQCLSVSTGFDDNTENVTIFIVWRPTTDGLSTLSLLEKYSNGSAYPYSLAAYSSGYVFATSDASTSTVAAGDIVRRNEAVHLVTAMRAKSGIMQIWVNGIQDTSGVSDSTIETTANDGNLFIGCKPDSSQYLDGDIGEVMIFSRILKTAERESIEEYLSQKWAIRLGAAT